MTIPSAPFSTASGESEAPSPPRRCLVVGLGNPGAPYVGTRHNVGFELVDLLARERGLVVDRVKCRARTASIDMPDGSRLTLAKPLTYMNLSGSSVAALLNAEKISPEDLLVLVDDIHLPPGRLRLRARGSDGGQNGLKSIVASLGTDAFARLRIGVGEPTGVDQIQWVLSRFGSDDRILVDDALTRAISVVRCWMERGITAAMNTCNAPGPV